MLARVMAMIILGYAAIGILICLAVAISTSFVSAMGEFFKSEVGIFSSAALCLLLGDSILIGGACCEIPNIFQGFGCTFTSRSTAFSACSIRFLG